MNVLDRIFAAKRAEVAEKSTAAALADLRALAADQSPTRGFERALRGADRLALIAEVKKGSPSKGTIRADFDPAAIGRDYASAGAACLSVLTDVEFFQGAPENLNLAREASGLPVLRKDFTTSEYHVIEARSLGADAILLIVNGLDNHELRDLRALAESLAMDVLVEAHSEGEADRAIASGAKLLGINNRDLETFQTSVSVGEKLIPHYAREQYVVAESALESAQDVRRMADAGARAVLIGTAFCSAPDIRQKVAEMMAPVWSSQ
ncbi:MAG: indole-3-glycerol phosphate synthase TrpC [Chthonomonas sp.]|nr:indole-3-glycerol phosphate synthase TrpC [Chthonomonas sp.]